MAVYRIDYSDADVYTVLRYWLNHGLQCKLKIKIYMLFTSL